MTYTDQALSMQPAPHLLSAHYVTVFVPVVFCNDLLQMSVVGNTNSCCVLEPEPFTYEQPAIWGEGLDRNSVDSSQLGTFIHW